MKIKIISDGTPHGTKAVNMETGEHIEHITDITWGIHINQAATGTIKLIIPEVDVIGEDIELRKTE